ncbi:MAG TPA: hypothetical protein VLZ81_01000, partial [Blastocatellia bacterium]|nr:hypothetical protein [Blastocatellia bacterium]
MKSKHVVVPFAVSLILAPIASALAWSAGGANSGNAVLRCFFAATVLVELLALAQAISARKLFSRSDAGYLTWTLIIAFLVVRLIAEARLITLTFDVVKPPSDIRTAASGLFFYVVWLRYLYTVSDVLFVAAIASAIRSYKMTGLTFGLMRRDSIYILLALGVPSVTYLFRSNLGSAGLINLDNYIATYRLVAVLVGGVIAALCLVVRRYASQMGGGAVARVWNAVVAAGIARDASFLTLALISKSLRPAAEFGEQYLLWVFAGCWLLAALYQQEVLP